jgi:hypothetical protein
MLSAQSDIRTLNRKNPKGGGVVWRFLEHLKGGGLGKGFFFLLETLEKNTTVQ